MYTYIYIYTHIYAHVDRCLAALRPEAEGAPQELDVHHHYHH